MATGDVKALKIIVGMIFALKYSPKNFAVTIMLLCLPNALLVLRERTPIQ